MNTNKRKDQASRAAYVRPTVRRAGEFQKDTGWFGHWYKDAVSERRFFD